MVPYRRRHPCISTYRILLTESFSAVIFPRTSSCLAVFVLLLGLWPRSGTAQSLWTKPYEPNQVALELLQPSLDTPANETVSFLTGAGILSGSYLLNDRTTFVAEVPFAHYQSEVGEDDPTSISESMLGNPYVGLGVSSTRVPFLVELGVRLPIASDSSAATYAGTATDLDQSEAFVAHLLSAQLLLNARWELSRIASVRFRGGPLVTVPTQDDGSTTELFVRYSVQGWYEGERYVLGPGLTGRGLITEIGSNFSDRTTHQVGGTLIFNFPRVQPGVLVRTPLNGPGSDAVDLIVGITLSVLL